MIFRELEIAGAHLVSVEPKSDERGIFARTFAVDEFVAHGLNPEFVQASIAFNPRRGTLRGMHLQLPPHVERKLVRCTRGSAFDVLVDLRHGSPTFLSWAGITLDAAKRDAVAVPEGVAHGYLTLEDDTELEYMISAPYEPGSALGVRWDDPAIGVRWPFAPVVIGSRDQAYPDLDRDRLLAEGLPALRAEGVQS